MRCGFWPVIDSYEYPCSSQSFPSDKNAGVSSKTFIVKNISNSLAWTVVSSYVCTSRLAVMTVVGLLNVVKVSNSAEFKSFLLIMCIDASESTTNSLSSGFRVSGACRHQFSEGEKNAVFIFLLEFWWYFWPTSTLLHGHIALAIPSLPETDPQILGIGVTLMRITWANHSKRWIFVSNVSMTHPGFSESNTSDWFPYVWALPQYRWRLRRLHILRYATQLSCNF